jgi:hypothetical protein
MTTKSSPSGAPAPVPASPQSNLAVKYAGIDGCRGGWAVAGLSDRLDWVPPVVCPSLADALRYTETAELTLVDIPLGLDDRRHFRACDLAARALLGARQAERLALLERHTPGDALGLRMAITLPFLPGR